MKNLVRQFYKIRHVLFVYKNNLGVYEILDNMIKFITTFIFSHTAKILEAVL
jgi:hypothetical protein